jgi:hypothetical protein
MTTNIQPTTVNSGSHFGSQVGKPYNQQLRDLPLEAYDRTSPVTEEDFTKLPEVFNIKPCNRDIALFQRCLRQLHWRNKLVTRLDGGPSSGVGIFAFTHSSSLFCLCKNSGWKYVTKEEVGMSSPAWSFWWYRFTLKTHPNSLAPLKPYDTPKFDVYDTMGQVIHPPTTTNSTAVIQSIQDAQSARASAHQTQRQLSSSFSNTSVDADTEERSENMVRSAFRPENTSISNDDTVNILTLQEEVSSHLRQQNLIMKDQIRQLRAILSGVAAATKQGDLDQILDICRSDTAKKVMWGTAPLDRSNRLSMADAAFWEDFEEDFDPDDELIKIGRGHEAKKRKMGSQISVDKQS